VLNSGVSAGGVWTTTDGTAPQAGLSGQRSNVPSTVRLRKPAPLLIDPDWPALKAPTEHDEDEARESTPPPHESIEWHLTYLAEAYLPSHAERLADTLTRLGWTITRWEPALDLVPSLREGPFGGGSTQLRLLVPEGTPQGFGFAFGDRLACPLPDGVSSIALKLWSVTPSLTMLVAACEWDEYWGDCLDRILRTDYRIGWLPRPGGTRAWSGAANRKQIEIRNRRREMHRRIASWLTERVPGAFEDLGEQHPALDVITAAGFRPYIDQDDPLAMWSYRRILSFVERFRLGESTNLPGLRLALPERNEPPVLTLAGQTIDVFDEGRLSRFGGDTSRWGLRNVLGEEVDALVVSWATISLLDAMRASLASFRDRTPEAGEPLARFAKRLSDEVPTALRRGADAGALCGDIRRQPQRIGPIYVLHFLTFIVTGPLDRKASLRESWAEVVNEEAARVSESEQDQRERLSTSVEVLGLGQNLRTQYWLLILTIVLAFFAAATIALGIIQLAAPQRTTTVQEPPAASAPPKSDR
jgi:hypothetical protein